MEDQAAQFEEEKEDRNIRIFVGLREGTGRVTPGGKTQRTVSHW